MKHVRAEEARGISPKHHRDKRAVGTCSKITRSIFPAYLCRATVHRPGLHTPEWQYARRSTVKDRVEKGKLQEKDRER